MYDVRGEFQTDLGRKEVLYFMKNRFVSGLMVMMFCVFSLFLDLPVHAMTVYESDGIVHEEGYIIIGESHAINTARVIGDRAEAAGNTFQWGGTDISYEFQWDGSIEVTPEGLPNTFRMKGNLFVVFEGISQKTDAKTQCSYEYIYSDGKGTQGRGVQKIHEIIDGNPNILHWNIISMCGASSAGKGKAVADMCAASYRNWIAYEFPEADCYFLSIATNKKYYRHLQDRDVYNRTLAAAFPEEFLDYSDFYAERYPERLVDTIHWDDETYVDLIEDVLWKIEERRSAEKPDSITEYTVTALQDILYTNDKTVVYDCPDLRGRVILNSCSGGLPVQITGMTDNRFYQIDLGGAVYYVPETGLSMSEQQ